MSSRRTNSASLQAFRFKAPMPAVRAAATVMDNRFPDMHPVPHRALSMGEYGWSMDCITVFRFSLPLEIDEYLQYRFLAGFLSEDPGFSDKIRGRMASLFSLEVPITKEWCDLVSRKSDGERRPSSFETF